MADLLSILKSSINWKNVSLICSSYNKVTNTWPQEETITELIVAHSKNLNITLTNKIEEKENGADIIITTKEGEDEYEFHIQAKKIVGIIEPSTNTTDNIFQSFTYGKNLQLTNLLQNDNPYYLIYNFINDKMFVYLINAEQDYLNSILFYQRNKHVTKGRKCVNKEKQKIKEKLKLEVTKEYNYISDLKNLEKSIIFNSQNN
jgi:galactitol-specific phosphotransferase system IIB component